MTTSLASQLQALKVKSSTATSQKHLASFIHEAKVAAKIDLRTTFEHAKQALDHLCGLDGALDVYQTTLLHPSKANAQYNRALLTKNENNALDIEIGTFLDALSPYFLLPPTHQVIEYMIRRYEIHVWNVENILGMIICYHESPLFARFITICDLVKTPRWGFLEPVKVNNTPLLRANLAKRCFADPSIVRFIYEAACRIGAKNPKIMALYTLLAIEIIDKSKISEQIMRWVLPNVIDGLRDRSYPEHQLAAYMVANKLASRATLAITARNQIAVSIAKSAAKHTQLDALLCLIGFVQSQPFESIPNDALKNFLKYEDIPNLIRDAMDSYDTKKFLQLLFAGLVTLLATEANAESVLFAVLTELSTEATMFIEDIVKATLENAKKHAQNTAPYKQILVYISKRYTEKLDSGLNKVLEHVDDEETRQFYVEFVAQTFSGTSAAVHVPLTEDGASLLLSLEHPNVDIRVQALQAAEKLEIFDETDALLRRLNDDSPRVISQAIKLSDHLLASSSPLAIIEAIAHAVNQRFRNANFAKSIEDLLSFLVGPFLAKHSEFGNQILDILLLFAPSKWSETVPLPLLEFSSWVGYLKKLKHPLCVVLKSPKDLTDVVKAWGQAVSGDELVEFVAAWASPSPLRHNSLPLLAMRVLFSARKNCSSAVKHFLDIFEQEWNTLNSLPEDESVHSDSLLSAVDMITTLMVHELAHDMKQYDYALSLLLHLNGRYFELVQASLGNTLAKNGWSLLLGSLCRIGHNINAQPVASVRSLTLVAVMIEYHSGAIKVNDLHQVMVSLLTSFNSGDANVRKAAAHCIKPLLKATVDKHDKVSLASYQNAMTALSKVKLELLMDGNYIVTLCRELIDHQKIDIVWAKHIISTALVKTSAMTPSLRARATQVLSCFKAVEHAGLWETTLSWFTNQLSSELAAEDTDIFQGLLEHYLFSWTKPTKAVFEAVLKVVSTRGLSSLQMSVASSLPAVWYSGLSQANQNSLIAGLVHLMHSGDDVSNVGAVFPRLSVAADILVKFMHHQKSPEWINQVTCVLEILPSLLPTYSTADLEIFLTPLQHVLTHFKQEKASEYSLQMVLTVLHQTCTLLSKKKSTVQPKSNHAKVLVELTMEVVEATYSPQTRNAALLFVSSLVELYPAEVLKSLVQILSQAANLQMDEYSFHVLQEIVHHAVPYVHQPNSPISSQQFLQSFVNGFKTIPAARRIELFHVVVDTLGQENTEALGLAITLLLNGSNDESRTTFVHDLCDFFAPEQQINALVYLVQAAGFLQDGEQVESDISLNTSSFKQAEATAAKLMEFVPMHLQRKELHYQILDKENDTTSLQEAFLLLAQAVLLYLRRPTTQDDEQLSEYAMDGMNKLQQLLTTPGFVAVIGELLQHDDGVIRRRALTLFNERIETTEDSLTGEEELLFVDMLSDLSDVLSQTTEAHVSDLQMALLSVDVLIRFFAKKHSKPFLTILPTIMDCTTHSNGHVVGSAFVCLSNLSLTLGPAVFPYVPKFFPTLLAALENSSSLKDETYTLQQCCMIALRNFTTKFPQFLVPYLSRMLKLLFSPSFKHPQVVISAQGALISLAQGMELRNLLPALLEMYPVCCKLGNDSTVQFFELVSSIVGGLDRAAVKIHLTGLMRLFLMSMDVRRLHPELSKEVEDQLLHAIMQLVLKLSEKQLKPLFLKFVSWVDMVLPGDNAPHVARQATFFRLVIRLSEQLRSIFVPYYAHILPTCASICAWGSELQDDAGEGDAFFQRPSKKQKTTVVVQVTKKEEVIEYATQALYGCFLHDTDGFMDKEKFDEVMPSLVDLLNLGGSHPAIVHQVVRALAHLAWSAKNDLLWKPMHHRILMKSRHDLPAVRLAALQTIEQCYTIVGEEFLSMLPESIPFLAELLEDSDAQVESLCHKVIKQIEELSGESLDQYLTA